MSDLPAALPDIEDMLIAGLPLWAAFQFWNEMMDAPLVPADEWWRKLRSTSPQGLQ